MRPAIFLGIGDADFEFPGVLQTTSGSSGHGRAVSAVFTLFMVSGRESAQPSPIVTVPQPSNNGIQGFSVINSELIKLARKLAIWLASPTRKNSLARC